MIIEIAQREYELHFGFDFIARLNELYYTEVNGVKYNNGLNMAVVGLVDEDPMALVNIIVAGLSTSERKPNVNEIKDYVLAESGNREGGLEDLVAEYLEVIKKQPLVKGKVKKIVKKMTEETAQE